MSFISTQNRRTLIAVFITLIITFEVIAYIATTPRQQDHYFQLYLLGANHTVSDYYPGNNAKLYASERITWYLGVSDNMGTVQFVSIRVKISNQSIPPPDDQQALGSPAPTIAEFVKFLQNNETWEVPFIWTISNITLSYGSAHIVILQINNETYQVPDWTANHGYNFRLIFELWTWQPYSNSFGFGWTNDDERQVAWLQMWFNATEATASSQ
jgi:hypothetical protein